MECFFLCQDRKGRLGERYGRYGSTREQHTTLEPFSWGLLSFNCSFQGTYTEQRPSVLQVLGTFPAKSLFYPKIMIRQNNIFFSYWKLIIFKNIFFLKFFAGIFATEYPKGIHLPRLYFYLHRTWEQRINSWVSWSSEDNFYKCAIYLCLSKDTEHTERDILGHTAHRATSLDTLHKQGFAPSPLLRHHHEQKQGWDLNCSLPHLLKLRVILHSNFILLAPSGQLDSGLTFK